MELQGFGSLIMQKTQVGHLVIWVGNLEAHIIAPEVMVRRDHGIAVDYYALGVIAYECMMGKVRTENNYSEALSWEVEIRNQRCNSIKASPNQKI